MNTDGWCDDEQYILPRQTHPFPRKTIPGAAQQQAQQINVTATLKPMRSGDAVTIEGLTLESTIHDVKTQYAAQSGQPQDRVKLLLQKKPAADLKTLKELGVEGENVEFSVMVMGGGSTGSGAVSGVSSPVVEKSEPLAAAKEDVGVPGGRDGTEMDGQQAAAPDSEQAQAQADEKVAEPAAAEGMLQTEEFWTDLQGFLAQRLRDEKEGEKLVGTFREAWRKR